ncbi:hypothetical protein FACS189425_09440 [Clostridia bacterium]|nr:hypothetical protein FACS189425_09440 [Clostridia bacterium]
MKNSNQDYYAYDYCTWNLETGALQVFVEPYIHLDTKYINQATGSLNTMDFPVEFSSIEFYESSNLDKPIRTIDLPFVAMEIEGSGGEGWLIADRDDHYVSFDIKNGFDDTFQSLPAINIRNSGCIGKSATDIGKGIAQVDKLRGEK